MDKIKMGNFNYLMQSGELVSEKADQNLDLKLQKNHQIRLQNQDDVIFLGTIHLGMPNTQPVKVAFDTGSEFLVVTSSFCDDATTPSEFLFRKIDEDNFEVNRTE